MSRVILVSCLICLVITGSSSFSEPEEYIVGGQIARPGQFPWHAVLRDLFNHHLCSGAIIHSRWVVSTAGCTQFRRLVPKEVKIIAGARSLNTGGTPFDVVRIVNHPFFNWNSMSNDISLIESKTDIGPTLGIRTIPIQVEVEYGEMAIVSGWGRYEQDSDYSPFLKFITAETQTVEDCRVELPDNVQHMIHDNSLCAINGMSRGNCFGDAGNPLIVRNELIGLASWGIPCAQNTSDVYTRIASHVDWINEIIDDEGEESGDGEDSSEESSEESGDSSEESGDGDIIRLW